MELGKVGRKSSIHADPQEAKEFVDRTVISSLDIGIAHGLYKGEFKIDLYRLSEIKEVVSKPLVLHGGSEIPDEAIKETIGYFILRKSYMTYMNNGIFLSHNY